MSKTGQTRRLAVGIEYDGTALRRLAASARPGDGPGRVQKALSAVADHPVTVTAAGRTDAGRPCLRPGRPFRHQAERPVRGWVLGANSHLPPDIAINWAMEVEPLIPCPPYGAGPQLSLLHAASRDAARDPARSRLLDRVRRSTSRRCTRRAQALVGEHDFTSFRAVECQSTTAVRHVDAISVRGEGRSS